MSTPRFLYHASAVGLSGEIRRPFVQTIDSQAASALPRYGGHARARIPDFKAGHVLAHTGVATEVTGAQKGNSFETTVYSSVTGLDLEGRVSIAALTACIHSLHPVRDPHPCPPPVEPAMSLAGTVISGVIVDGQPVELEPLFDFSAPDTHTMSGLREYYRKNTNNFKDKFVETAWIGRENELPENVRHFFPWRGHQPSSELHQCNEMHVIPLYRVKNAKDLPNFKIYGNCIVVPNFGRIHLGELIVESNRRRVMMLRAELGSPCEGDINGGCSDGGGVDPPGN